MDLLFHLKNRELRVIDLVDLTGKYHQYVSKYLYRMRNYGLTEKNGSFWRLTPLGVSFLSYLRRLDNNKIIIRQKEDRNKTFGRQKEDTYSPKRVKQVLFDLWLQNSSLDDAEREVVEVLMDHYNRTGSKFILVKDIYELAQRVKSNPLILPDVLKNLRQDNIIYLFRSKMLGCWKIGLKKAFVQKLEASQR